MQGREEIIDRIRCGATPREAETSIDARPEATVVCVLGFDRSGTSVTTRLLNLLGMYLGPMGDLLEPDATDNPRGYWEPRWVIALNDELLAMRGGTQWRPPRAEPGWEWRPEFEPLRERAARLLADKFGAATLWGWKDPRTTLTLPFWRSLVPDARYVICVRNPLDAIASLQRRLEPKLSTTAWGTVWMDYTLRALEQTHGKRRLLVVYEDVVDHPASEIARLAGFLGVDNCDPEPLVASVEAQLCHHRHSLLELALDDRLPMKARALFLALRAHRDERRRAAGGPTS